MLHEICSTLLQRKGLGDEQIKCYLAVEAAHNW